MGYPVASSLDKLGTDRIPPRSTRYAQQLLKEVQRVEPYQRHTESTLGRGESKALKVDRQWYIPQALVALSGERYPGTGQDSNGRR